MPQDLARQANDLSTAIQRDNLLSAAEIAAKLDDAVQAQKRAWLVRDSSDRAQEVLSWLPEDIESFWVNQSPFVLDKEKLTGSVAERAIQSYSLDRLIAQNDGKYYDALNGRTVRMVMAAARGIPPRSSSIPAPIGARDVVYFYFLVDPSNPQLHEDETIEGRPVWNLVAHEDKNWLALARPDLLILSNQKDLLAGVLKQMKTPSSRGANLSEWNQVDRSASFFGFRRYTAGSKPRPRERGCNAARLPAPDCLATAASLKFDATTHQLEIRYLSGGPLDPNDPTGTLRGEFKIDQPESGVWRLISDFDKRGAFPFHFGMIMLGFGEYQ